MRSAALRIARTTGRTDISDIEERRATGEKRSEIQTRNSELIGKIDVLKDVSFEISEGEALCILGRSGTGKSVTLKLIIGLLRPDQGAVCIQEENIVGMEQDQLSAVRRRIAAY